MAVPVRSELLARVTEDGQRMIAAFGRAWQERRLIVDGLARGLPEPARLLEQAMQQLDSETDRLVLARDALLRDRRAELQTLVAGLHSPAALVARAEQTLAGLAERLPAAILRLLQGVAERTASVGKLLDSLSWRGVLERGFALVRDAAGTPVLRAASLASGAEVEIEFADGVRGATVHVTGDGGRRPRGQRRRKAASGSPGDDPQGNLL
jgi:exodeoxyribonuclease VII large subunit